MNLQSNNSEYLINIEDNIEDIEDNTIFKYLKYMIIFLIVSISIFLLIIISLYIYSVLYVLCFIIYFGKVCD
jgi:hypothetical protein